MTALVFKIATTKCLQNHCYNHDGLIYNNGNHGVIGLDLMRCVAGIYMARWGEKYINFCSEITENTNRNSDIKINLVPRMLHIYVDDDWEVREETPVGAVFDSDTNTIKITEEQKKVDENKSADRRTFDLATKLANLVDPDIVMSAEVPSDRPSGKVPYLDTQLWVEESTEHPEGKLMFQFFEKAMNTDKVIRKGSAINNKTTITILTQEGIRHMRNCHPDIDKETRNNIMSNFMLKLRKSGYDEVERKRVLASAMNGYSKQVEDDKSGKKPLYSSCLLYTSAAADE